jgi:hypothetical protein
LSHQSSCHVAHAGHAESHAGKLGDHAGCLCLPGLLGRVLHIDVRHLVPHHASQFTFAFGSSDRPEVDEHLPAGDCKRIDLLLRHDMKFKWP